MLFLLFLLLKKKREGGGHKIPQLKLKDIFSAANQDLSPPTSTP